MRRTPTCGACGQPGHNRRTCKSPIQRPAKGTNRRPSCARCQRDGHKAAACDAPFPMLRLEGGEYTVKPEFLVAVVSRRYQQDGLYDCIAGYQQSPTGPHRGGIPTYDLIVYGDGAVRVYIKDRVDSRLTVGSGPLPWCEDADAMDAHFDKVEEGESAPVQLALPAASGLFSESRFSIPTWDEDEL